MLEKIRKIILNHYFLSFALPALIMLFYFYYRKMAPFGNSSILTVDRSVYYSIEKMNQFLDEKGFDKVINVKNLGFYLNQETISALEKSKRFNNEKNEEFFNFSGKQRIETIIWLLINREKVSLTLIETKFNVSRNTADKDFKKIGCILKNYQLSLSKNSGGHMIDLYITRSFTANGRLLASIVIVLIALVIGSVVGYRKFKKDGFIGKKKLNKDEQHE